jgi:hypothetical protein
MEFMAVALTHSVAREQGKMPFFFSRYTFQRMKELGNTHYCFHCGGNVGFKPGPDGKPTNQMDGNYDPMKNHTAEHANAVIGSGYFRRIARYDFAGDWVRAQLRKRKNFPYVVAVT